MFSLRGFLFFFRRRIIGDNKWMAILPLHQWMEMEGWFWFTLYRDPCVFHVLETAIYLWFQRSAFVAGWGLDRWTFSRLSVYSLRDDTNRLGPMFGAVSTMVDATCH